MIKAVTFDYWDTLYHGAGARDLRMKRLTEALNTHSYAFDQAALDEADRVAWTEWTRVWRDEHRTSGASDWLRLMLDHLGAALPATTFDGLAVQWDEIVLHADTSPQLVDGAAGVVRRLAQQYRLGIISDTGLSSGRTLRRLLERDGIDAYFTCLSFSDETGVSKPHPDAFRRTLKCLGAQPAETIHIGDLTRTDIAGAKAVGMRAVRFSGSNDDPDRSIAPDAAVGTFADFELLVRTWDGKS
jgi:putative hydrolase of the HAD superfamily